MDCVADGDQAPPPPGDTANPFGQFQRDLECKDEGPDIDTNLASLVQAMLKKSPSDEKVKEKLKDHKKPQNCPLLVTPRVNKEVWDLKTSVGVPVL
jgi:hypothetical protein